MVEVCLSVNGNSIICESVELSGTINDLNMSVELKYKFLNNYGKKGTLSKDAIFNFPIDQDSAVTDFTAVYDNQTIKGILKEKQEAIVEYKAALAARKAAFLMKESDEQRNILALNIGGIKSGSTVIIMIKYITTLRQFDRSVEFLFQFQLVPKYKMSGYSFDADKQIKPVSILPSTINKELFEEEDKLNDFYYINPTTFAINNLKVHMPSKITKIISHQQLFNIHSIHHDNARIATITLPAIKRQDADLLITIDQEDANKPRLLIELPEEHETIKTACASLTFFPPKLDKIDLLTHNENEFYFMLDVSGSMNGDRLDILKKAMNVVLKSLPTTCYFTIIAFESQYEYITGTPNERMLSATKTNIDQAIIKVNNLSTRGGTEFIVPLQHILTRIQNKNYSRQVIILTDCGIDKKDVVTNMIKTNINQSTRLFVIGIGNEVDQLLLEQISTTGNGLSCTYYDHSTELNTTDKIMNIITNALQPCLSNISVTFNDPAFKYRTTTHLKPIYPTDKNNYVIYMMDLEVPNDVIANLTNVVPFRSQITLKYNNNCIMTIPFDNNVLTHDMVIHKLAARKYIEETKVKELGLALSLQYGILSRHTAFVMSIDNKLIDGGGEEVVVAEKPNEIIYETSAVLQNNQSSLFSRGPPPQAVQYASFPSQSSFGTNAIDLCSTGSTQSTIASFGLPGPTTSTFGGGGGGSKGIARSYGHRQTKGRSNQTRQVYNLTDSSPIVAAFPNNDDDNEDGVEFYGDALVEKSADLTNSSQSFMSGSKTNSVFGAAKQFMSNVIQKLSSDKTTNDDVDDMDIDEVVPTKAAIIQVLVNDQLEDGSWEWKDSYAILLKEYFNKSLIAFIKSASPDKQKYIMTATILVIFNEHYEKHKITLSMIEAKGQTFLNQNKVKYPEIESLVHNYITSVVLV